MPTPELLADYETVKRNYHEVTNRLVELLEQLAVTTLVEKFPEALTITVDGAHDEDGDLRLAVQFILDGNAHIIWNGDVPDETIDQVNGEYLDWLASLTGDDWAGQHDLDMEGHNA